MAPTAHRRGHRSGSATHRISHHHGKPADPITAPILPPPLPPISAADKPAERPKRATPLIKTQYNTRRLRYVLAGGGVFLTLIVAGILVANWPRFKQVLGGSQAQPAQYRLSVQAEKLNVTKAEQIMQQIRQTTPSASLQSTASATPAAEIPGQLSIPPASVLAGYSPDQLHTILAEQMKQLQAEHQSTRLLELLESSGTKTDLLKAIQLGKEYQALYLYYKK